MSINEVRWLSECGSTNAYAKEHFEEFGPVGAVYTTNQTAGPAQRPGVDPPGAVEAKEPEVSRS